MSNSLRDMEEEIKAAFMKALQDTSVTVESKAKQMAPYDTGNLRDSITAERLSDFEYQVTANTEYALAVHEGHQQGNTFVQGVPFLSQPMEEEAQNIVKRFKENL